MRQQPPQEVYNGEAHISRSR